MFFARMALELVLRRTRTGEPENRRTHNI
jgi:hypothetical protein